MSIIVHPIFPVNKAGSSDQISAVLNELKRSEFDLIISDSTCVATDNSMASNKESITEPSIHHLIKSIQKNPKSKHILLTADPVMIDTVKQVKKSIVDKNIDIFSVMTSHKLDKNVTLAVEDETFDLIGVPSYEIPRNIPYALKEKIVPTTSVPTTLSLEKLEEEFEHAVAEGVIKRDILNQKNHLVVLPGDFTNSKTNKIERYTIPEAQNLAVHLIAQRSEGEFLFICDGPRTGKHDENGNVYENSHQVGAPINPIMDAFITELEKRGLEKGKDFDNFEFKFNAEIDPYEALMYATGRSSKKASIDARVNPYKALMYATSQSGKKISIDGASVSMLGADTSALSQDVKITGIGSNAVLKSPAHHNAFIQSNAYATLLTPIDGTQTFDRIDPRITSQTTHRNDAKLMATKIFEKSALSFVIEKKRYNKPTPNM